MRDKVDHPDPAIAPLGTDEEAGGAQTPPEEVARALDKRGRSASSEQEADEEDGSESSSQRD